MADLVLSGSQTAGPYLHIGLLREPIGPEVVSRTHPDAIVIRGRLLDGAGAAVADGMIETWQADPAGRYDAPDFSGIGRSGADDEGWFEVVTVKPGRVAYPDGRLQAPHLAVSVFARGLLKRLVTRLYFADEVTANDEDPVLAGLSALERATLLGVPDEGFTRFDIRLQGTGQTTFFAI
jgi:protocatechuate 3,4-dioxygenase alpha subunit